MKWLSDSGHAWLQVPLEDLIRSGVAHNISQYSYYKAPYAYLEEDFDASIYLATLAKTPIDIPEQFYNTECPVRSYARFPQLPHAEISNA